MMNNLLIPTDGNELRFVRKQVVNKIEYYFYEYTKSLTKLGQILQLSKEQLERLLKEKICKEICE